jgi:hypothetical protein
VSFKFNIFLLYECRLNGSTLNVYIWKNEGVCHFIIVLLSLQSLGYIADKKNARACRQKYWDHQASQLAFVVELLFEALIGQKSEIWCAHWSKAGQTRTRVEGPSDPYLSYEIKIKRADKVLVQ